VYGVGKIVFCLLVWGFERFLFFVRFGFGLYIYSGFSCVELISLASIGKGRVIGVGVLAGYIWI